MIKAGRLHVPFGAGKHAPIAAEDQARVIASILEDPATHNGKIYPLFGPFEYTYRETAHVLSRVLGKNVEYKQVDFEEFKDTLQAGEKATAEAKGREGNDFLFQHLREVALDHQNGIFAGTNDLVEKIGGRPPMTLEKFITKHRKAFE
jgi:NAD(P)H dehydrogenase (quinone)